MYKYKVIDIHPEDAWHSPPPGYKAIKPGDVIESMIESELREWTEENCHDPNKYGWLFGSLGARVFHAIKVEEITDDEG